MKWTRLTRAIRLIHCTVQAELLCLRIDNICVTFEDVYKLSASYLKLLTMFRVADKCSPKSSPKPAAGRHHRKRLISNFHLYETFSFRSASGYIGHHLVITHQISPQTYLLSTKKTPAVPEIATSEHQRRCNSPKRDIEQRLTCNSRATDL
jgi:hypothetical protein